MTRADPEHDPPDDWVGAAVRAAVTVDPLELEAARASLLGAIVGDPPPPPRVGRYVVLDRLGKGATGVVYRAYDPELHRRVAIKLLRPDALAPDGGVDRLLREARTIARLSHPNIVAVHDLGTLGVAHQGVPPRVFVVIELVEGQSVEQWLAAAPRSWREVLDVMTPIGRALAAAHREGIVHRDVKPANMLLGDALTPKLTDFGVASVPVPGDTDASDAGRDPWAGVAVGTPATMAPEQHVGAVADARSDQYGYCASLYLALAGRAPFEARLAAELLAAKRACKPAPLRDVPPWLFAIVRRGLSPEPGDRFADMDALTDALVRGRRRGRRRVAIAAATAACVGALALAWQASAPSSAARCAERGAAVVAESWTPASREAVRAGLRRVRPQGAEAVADAVEAELDAAVERYAEARARSCEGIDAVDDPRRHEQIACIDGLLADVGELATLLAQADPEVYGEAIHAARRLPDAASCSEGASPQATTDRALETDLRRARLHLSAGRFASAAALADDALRSARSLGDLRSIARALDLQCSVAVSRGDRAAIEQGCSDAWLAAERANEPRTGLTSLFALAHLHAGSAEAERLLALAQARLDGLDAAAVQPWLRMRYGAALSWHREAQGRLTDALAIAREALDQAIAAYGADHGEIVLALNAVANLETRVGRLASAASNYRRAIAIVERERGPTDPDLGALLHNLGGAEYERGDYELAIITLERALAIKIAAVGPTSARVVGTLHRLARARMAAGDGARALADAEQALAIARDHASGDAPLRASSQLALAEVLAALTRCDDALAVLAQRAPQDYADDERGVYLTIRGRCRARIDDPAALDDLREATAALTRFYGPDARDLVAPLVSLSRWHRQHGDAEEAERVRRRAVEICDATEGGELECGPARALVAG
ncbi:MAG: serine/threonine-protein kinase [Nannocystaceae bacterium]|nr:serine/threonine-protein kinase [Nannocystaceae bacterium]